jgi:hypothetical protein
MPERLPRLPRIPAKPKMTTAEANIGGTWRVITVQQALDTVETDARCIECHEPVRAHKASVNGMAAHFEHRDKNVRCSLLSGR